MSDDGLDAFGRPVVKPEPELDESRDWSLPPEPGHKPTRESLADRAKRTGGPLAALLIALSKIGLLLKIPALGTVLTGAVSIVAYAWLFGYPFAFWLVTSLMVHELGHAIQVKREGLQVKALNFVPFLGAYVMHEATQDRAQQARISIAGPIAGALFASVIYLFAGDSRLLMAVAYTGFFLNLLNLLPIGFLDGGGVGRVFSSAWWLIVAAALGVIALGSATVFAGLLALICLFLAFSHREAGWALDLQDGVAQRDRLSMAVLFIAVSAVCAFGMAASFVDRSSEIVGHSPAPVVHVAFVGVSPAPR